MSLYLIKGKRIFLTEDNLNNRTIMELILTRYGAVIGFERWGTNTIEKLTEFAPVDLILMDLMLPRGVTGYDVFKQIRQYEQFLDVPIVAVSASDSTEAIPKAKATGFAGYISKPIDFVHFPHQIVSILQGESIWDED